MKFKIMKNILFFLLLISFFSCKKDMLYENKFSVVNNNGILHVKYFSSLNYRNYDTLCFIYEAIRFYEKKSELQDCPDSESHPNVRVNAQLRLVNVHKSTGQVIPVSNWHTYSNVGGLNISWYLYPPLHEYWYAIEFNYCYRVDDVNGMFFVIDFWGSDGMRTHTDPFWGADVIACISSPISAGDRVAHCTLNSDCSISP